MEIRVTLWHSAPATEQITTQAVCNRREGGKGAVGDEMTPEELKQLPMMDDSTLAFAKAICDVIASERCKFKAIMDLLYKNGIVSIAEIEKAFEPIPHTPPDILATSSTNLYSLLQKRLATRYEELLSVSNPPEKNSE
ncbi:MAG: hypothetical protein ACLP59_15965 [Bryobacteraceae bacterium]